MNYDITDELIYANSMGPNPLKLLRWNLAGVKVPAGSKVLDLGSGMGLTAVSLANEFDADVIAYDLDVSAEDALATMLRCNPTRVPLPLQGDARKLPFAKGYFDFIIATDSYIYFGTDDLYAPYLRQFLKPGGLFCFTVPGFNRDVAGDAELPDHLRPFWADECWTWHTAQWWRTHIERTGHFRVLTCEAMPDSYTFWRQETLNGPEDWCKNDLPVVDSDQGEYMGFVKVVAQLTA